MASSQPGGLAASDLHWLISPLGILQDVSVQSAGLARGSPGRCRHFRDSSRLFLLPLCKTGNQHPETFCARLSGRKPPTLSGPFWPLGSRLTAARGENPSSPLTSFPRSKVQLCQSLALISVLHLEGKFSLILLSKLPQRLLARDTRCFLALQASVSSPGKQEGGTCSREAGSQGLNQVRGNPQATGACLVSVKPPPASSPSAPPDCGCRNPARPAITLACQSAHANCSQPCTLILGTCRGFIRNL